MLRRHYTSVYPRSVVTSGQLDPGLGARSRLLTGRACELGGAGRGQPGAAGFLRSVLVFLLPQHEQHAQLAPEVGPRDGVQEEVDAVVDVEDGARDEGHAPEVVEVGGPREGGDADVVRRQEHLEPRGEVRDVEGDEAEADDEEDEGELQADDAFLCHHAHLLLNRERDTITVI